MSDNTPLWTILIVAEFLILLRAVTTATLPGTLELEDVVNPGQQEPRYDLTATIGVEGTVTGAKINTNSFRTDITKSGLFSLSLIGPNPSALSLTGARDMSII